jgi:CheY-like chemotaxis protein
VDIGLPGLTGFELARHARAAGYAGRMIALSGYGAERDAQEALVAGFDAYLVKPVDRAQLRASLSED